MLMRVSGVQLSVAADMEADGDQAAAVNHHFFSISRQKPGRETLATANIEWTINQRDASFSATINLVTKYMDSMCKLL